MTLTQIPSLNGVDLTVNSGKAIAIIGLSGNGKLTILRLICGLLAPDLAKLYVNGNLLTTDYHQTVLGFVRYSKSYSHFH